MTRDTRGQFASNGADVTPAAAVTHVTPEPKRMSVFQRKVELARVRRIIAEPDRPRLPPRAGVETLDEEAAGDAFLYAVGMLPAPTDPDALEAWAKRASDIEQ